MTLEKLAEQIFNECAKDGEPVTKEESLEMARMELGAKDIKVYEHAEKGGDRPKKPKTVKISDEKAEIFEFLVGVLSEKYDFSIVKPNKMAEIRLNGKIFKLDLIENRPKK